MKTCYNFGKKKRTDTSTTESATDYFVSWINPHQLLSAWLCLVSGVRCFRLLLSKHNASLSATLF